MLPVTGAAVRGIGLTVLAGNLGRICRDILVSPLGNLAASCRGIVVNRSVPAFNVGRTAVLGILTAETDEAVSGRMTLLEPVSGVVVHDGRTGLTIATDV